MNGVGKYSSVVRLMVASFQLSVQFRIGLWDQRKLVALQFFRNNANNVNVRLIKYRLVLGALLENVY